MPPKRDRLRQKVAAHARQDANRDRTVNPVWTALKWIALRTLEGGLPEAGKVLFRIGAGGLAALAARWLYGE